MLGCAGIGSEDLDPKIKESGEFRFLGARHD